MKPNPVGWFEIYTQDLDRAKRFYESVLTAKLERLESPPGTQGSAMEMWTFPMDHTSIGAGGALVKMEGMPSGGNSTLVYFTCDDCSIEEARVAAAGGRVQRSKMAIGEHGFISLVFDTEGNLFGLHSLR
ncbi:MAG: VOC family protein [Proteobacteria bacterium]|nr:VOC family protein [Burkholderiales bacterium]